MKWAGWLISKYLLQTVTPYFVLSWLLLSVILFVQQASRYSDIYFSANIPTELIWQLTIALVPNVIAFTCPMAMLIGTIIGLTKMQGDSELVAIRASGIGNLQVALPLVLLGVLMSGFAFLVNLKGVPLAASLVRSVALQSAIAKLESPIEPGVFNTEVAGYTIYVKGGDLETRTWKNIFIYSEETSDGSVRLITSRSGRIDVTGQQSELVLENATVSTLPLAPATGKYVSENIKDLRFAIKTKRSDLIDRLSTTQIRPEELGLQQLAEYAESKEGSDRVEARLLWQRRLMLSITPLIFCILGTVIVLRFERAGKGIGIAMALVVLIGFYLLAFLGEQLARVGAIGLVFSSLIPIMGSLVAIVWLNYSRRFDRVYRVIELLRSKLTPRAKRHKPQASSLFMDLTTGLRDFDLIRNLLGYFVISLLFLTSIFLIFTAFEHWRFAGTFEGGGVLLAKYLAYLLPFIYLQIAPSAAMIATLATYVVKSRNNEIVTWTAAGQSVYRLLFPCFVLAIGLGVFNWAVQETILPIANQRQDSTRSLIRNRGVPVSQPGRYWVANEQRIYSFELESDNGKSRSNTGGSTLDDRVSDNAGRTGGEEESMKNVSLLIRFADQHPAAPDGSRKGMMRFASVRLIPTTILSLISASDNDNQVAHCVVNCAKNVVIYEFADNGERLQAVFRAEQADWANGRIRLSGRVEVNELNDGRIALRVVEGRELVESVNPFTELRAKPNHLNTSELRRKIDTVESEVERRSLRVSLERKYTSLFLPLVMALFTAPFALSLSRSGKAATVGYAVLLWLLFTGTSTVFDQMGASGMLPAGLAVWSPLFIFTLIGAFLLSKVRT